MGPACPSGLDLLLQTQLQLTGLPILWTRGAQATSGLWHSLPLPLPSMLGPGSWGRLVLIIQI